MTEGKMIFFNNFPLDKLQTYMDLQIQPRSSNKKAISGSIPIGFTNPTKVIKLKIYIRFYFSAISK